MTTIKRAVLVMSYGTPAHTADVEAYYTHIRRGKPPSPEQLAQLTHRYEAIGGTFPLRANTDRQVEALQKALREAMPQWEIDCYQGLKHAVPFVEDGVAQMKQAGVTHAIGVVLAPHYSSMSVGSYIRRAQAEAKEQGISLLCIERYGMHPQLIDLLTSRVQEQIDAFSGAPVEVIFTAHSLPERILSSGDPYPEELQATARAIADRLQLPYWSFAWQSAGQTGEPWLGPDLLEKLPMIQAERPCERVIVCPIGFVSDHLEVLYDLDQEAVSYAQSLGIQLKRTRMLNDDPRYIDVLVDVVRAQHAFWES